MREELQQVTVAEAGELGLLAEVLRRIATGDALLGPGDDAAVLSARDGRYVVTTDTMIEGADFRHEWSTPHQLGLKAVTSNLADIAAMGATPTGLVVALALPRTTTVGWVTELIDGFAAQLAALAPGCGIVGGDLATSPVTTIAVTAFGSLDGRAPVTRAGAQVGDVIAVAGPLGHAAAGLQLLFAGADERSGDPLIAAQLAPTAPIAAGPAAARAGATAMMDLSDGLLLDASRLATASGVCLDFDDALVAPAVEALSPRFDAATARRLVYGGGEDHSLLATFPADAALPQRFSALGRVVVGSGVAIDGTVTEPAGWDPYAPDDTAA